MITTILLEKTKYSELPIRKALYWLSEYYQWSLREKDDEWIVEILSDVGKAEQAVSMFCKLHNDFLLRDQLDSKTNYLREKIVFAALDRIANVDR